MKWHSVKESLPDTEIEVLTSDINGNASVCMIIEGKWRYSGCYFDHECNCKCIAPVRYWLELPEAPEDDA